MKSIFTILLFLLQFNLKAAEKVNIDDPNIVLTELCNEVKLIQKRFEHQKITIQNRVINIQVLLKTEPNLEKKVNLLIEKDELQEKLKIISENEYNEISKIRYIKGLQVLKILYEKILGLDHHFATVYTFSEINKISNPNNYPEFLQVKEIVKNKKNKRFNLDLGSLLSGNPIASATQTFINLLDLDLTSGEKRKELQNIECILDFTLNMHNELNTIYFETTYLQAGNQKIKSDIETLFTDYTKPIGYERSLQDCRSKDDWDSVKDNLNNYLKNSANTKDKELFKRQVNIEFPVDRLLRFIEEYNGFIDQSEQFYRKFKIILNSYQTAPQCQSQLPPEFNKLKSDMDIAIEKFNVAYKPVEINGSKMKEILYGINDFD